MELTKFIANFKEPSLVITTEGNLIDCNESFCDLFQIKRNEIIGLNLSKFLNLLKVPPFSMESLLRGEPQQMIFKRNNEPLKTVRWYATLVDENEEKLIVLTVIDISALIQKISKAEKLQASIIDLIPDHFILWKNKNLVYLGCNQAAANSLGLNSPEDIIGKTDYDLATTKEQSDAYRADDQQVIREGKAKLEIEERQTIHGVKRILLTSKAPLFDEEGNIEGVVVIYSDITERKKMEKDLEKAKVAAESASQAKTEFIANMSHDIRTPLTGIITFSRFLREQDELSETARKELAEDTYHASEQLLNLLNGVLDIILADTATDNEVFHKPFDLFQMIEEIIQLEKPAIKSHHLELKQSIDKNIPRYIVSDKTKLHRILLNLIGNAIKFTERGYIELGVNLQSRDERKATLVFSVKDTGIGIPGEAQAHIFERFYKVSPSYKGKYTGNGLGLHIVQKYVQLLGGTIGIHSIFGKGTTFLVTLTFSIGESPQEDEDKSYKAMLKQDREDILLEEQVPVVTSIAANNIDSTIKVLLIEDNPFALKSLKVLFMPFKLHVLEAKSAEDAFELVKKETFDLIITDIGLPDMQGDELVVKIRQLEHEIGRPRAKIVALTGHALVEGELAYKWKKLGIDGLFQKPMQPKLLKSLLDPFMKKSQEKTKSIPEPAIKEKISSSVEGKLGLDLPDTEAELFEINYYPLLDLKVGEEVLGSEDLVKSLLKDLKKVGIEPDLERLEQAHTIGDWKTVGALAHKIKGGSTLGTVRLYYALLYMERYLKAGHTRCAEALYAQMLRVINETVDYLDKLN
ncbi:sensory box histidine kinase/response regulator [Legionella nautarum]|uniref:histidine kinase n=1 Tax=Legionella nautarum TaxID=45070 RepID=A0A0W0WZF4_9GAMM|nr:PAS domain-containing hybrid sensor histidine kinase/response regulator [Legionella nautarum]KTD37707.1 sensory box histidine kinase/response regulator [Legionella nautarum]